MSNESGRRKPAKSAADVCPICGGAGFIMPDLPLGHADFGKAVPCRCRQQQQLEKRMRTLQSIGELEVLQRLTFDSFVPQPSHLSPQEVRNLRMVYEKSRAYAQEPHGWLLLTGTFGCGKTHLAAAIANARLNSGQSALFLLVPDLLDHLRAAYNPNNETSYDDLFEQVRNTPLLILDDLGTQSSTPWAQEKLFQLLNHRYNAQLPTVITTNQNLDELEPRLRSRLMDVALVDHLHIIAPDFRSGESRSQLDLSALDLYRSKRFESFNLRRSELNANLQENLHKIINACKEYANEPQGWLVLQGESGCGKTHLAAAIANHQLEKTQNKFEADQILSQIIFVEVPELMDYLRASFSPQSNKSYDQRFDEIKKVSMLVLDHFGIESASPWVKEKLFQLLNYRYNTLLPTVITTTYNLDEIEPWLRTRMLDKEKCKYCIIGAPGIHQSKKVEQNVLPSTTRRRPTNK